mmetsp:Transcript_7074/g.21233  ORF Transcript_7074/g.21233 Transcript_7074/m.21233 type:complete len:271 (+) Transcript_7074:1280-2092(+)
MVSSLASLRRPHELVRSHECVDSTALLLPHLEGVAHLNGSALEHLARYPSSIPKPLHKTGDLQPFFQRLAGHGEPVRKKLCGAEAEVPANQFVQIGRPALDQDVPAAVPNREGLGSGIPVEGPGGDQRDLPPRLLLVRVRTLPRSVAIGLAVGAGPHSDALLKKRDPVHLHGSVAVRRGNEDARHAHGVRPSRGGSPLVLHPPLRSRQREARCERIGPKALPRQERSRDPHRDPDREGPPAVAHRPPGALWMAKALPAALPADLTSSSSS